jgi:tetratricopeptide (TPR) repeat protein
VSNLNAAEHLKIARRLHFQGQHDEAVREYILVLEIDPDNEDARAGLISLGVEPPDTSRFREADSGSAVKTNFFVNQAKSGELPTWRTGPFKVVIVVLGGLLAWGIYQGVMMGLNWDNIKAAQNVDAHISKLKTTEDGGTIVNVKVANYNPGPIKNVLISYQLLDAKGNMLKEGKVKVDGTVPPGDARTFVNIDLGQIKDKPDKIEQKVESLVYGPKPKIKDRLVDRFVEASAIPDKEAFGAYDELTQDLDDFPPALVGMGRAYAARGDYKRAIGQYDKALENDPEFANAHYYKAVALYYNNDKANAKKEMEKALELQPDDPQYQESAKMLAGRGEKTAEKQDEKSEETTKEASDE